MSLLLSPRRAAALLAAAGAVIAIAVLATDRPATAAPGDTQPKGVLVGLLLPFADHSERGMVRLTFAPKQRSLTVVTESGDPSAAYSVRLSRRTCGAIGRNPAAETFSGPSLTGDDPFINTFWEVEDFTPVTARQVRAARSVVLLAETSDGKFEPRACSATFRLEDVLISSVRSGELRGVVAAAPRGRKRVVVYSAFQGLPVKDGTSNTLMLVAHSKPCSQAVDVVDYVSWRTPLTAGATGNAIDKSTPKIALKRPRSARVWDVPEAGEPTELACGPVARVR